jgi:2-methylcitrate dehydratase PrpD
MLNALGIVLTQIGGTMLPVMAYTHSFKISQGLAGWNGIVSAELAKRGFTGPKNFLFGQFGYYQQYSREVKPEILTAGLGETFYADEEFKVYPCCRGNAAPVETALKLVNQCEINPENISSIYVDLSPMWQGSFLVQPFEIGPCPQAGAILNLRYNVAGALLRKEAKLDNYNDESISDRRVLELVNKIKINPTVPGKRMSCRIRVITEDGHELSAYTEEPKGDYRVLPLSKDDVRAKFIDSVKFSNVITVAQAKKALEILDNLEKVENLSELVGNLIPVSHNRRK